MTNHYLVPNNLTDLKKMFCAIQQRRVGTPKIYCKEDEVLFKQREVIDREVIDREVIDQEMTERFTVSFFDGVKRISCQMYWEDLAKAVNFKENKLKFERKPEVQLKYDTFLEKMRRENKSIYQHVLKNEMKIDSAMSIGEENKFTICQNKYPYDFGTHRHFLLWIHPDCDEVTNGEIFDEKRCYKKIALLAKTHRDILGDKFIIFRNATINKSVHTIEHFHVVCY